MRAKHVLLLIVFILFCAGAYFFVQKEKNIPAPDLGNQYQFYQVACWFDADWKADIFCGELHTPEGRGKFILPVVVIRAEEAGRKADPVVYLQGGPGASAKLHTEGIKSWLSWAKLSALQRDLILIDTRGTGRSRPALVCADYNRDNKKLLRENETLTQELEQSYVITQRCFQNASASNAALNYRNFGTEHSARDVRALIDKLNYDEWNIIAVSYGTRLALEIARQEQTEPKRARLKSMVLDSIYPAGFGGVQTWPQVLDDAIQGFIDACAGHKKCDDTQDFTKKQLTDLLVAALDRLKVSPLEITVRHWSGEPPITWLVNDHRLMSLVFSGIYDPADWPKILSALKGTVAGQSDKLEALAEPYLNNSVSADFNSLTFTAVDCADNPIKTEAEYFATVDRYPMLQAYTRDQWRYQACHYLPTKNPLQLAEPQVPTLILAGENDPITPVSWAKEIHSRWPQTQLRINDSLAHSVLSSDLCLLENLWRFFDEPKAPFMACSPSAATAVNSN